MSWTLGTTTEAGDDFATVIGAAELSQSYGDAGEHVLEQVQAAKDAAVALVGAGVFGDPETVGFLVSLHGHANPGHVPAAGWANDCVTVSISQKSVE